MFEAGEFEPAAEMALETLYADAMNPVAHRIRALSLIELKQVRQSKQALEVAILTNPDDEDLKALSEKFAR